MGILTLFLRLDYRDASPIMFKLSESNDYTYKKLSLKSQTLSRLNEHMHFLVLIGCYAFKVVPNCFRNHHAKFETGRTILTCQIL